VKEVHVLAVERTSRWRHLIGAMLAAVALLLLQPRAAQAEPNVPNPPNQLITDTGEGEISDADKDFAVKVRLAGLWEIPAGEMAQQKSDDPRIQAIGKDIAAQHVVLDQMVRAVGKKLDITLPNKPNADQQGWLAEMRAAEGTEFDQIYIDRLRAAHGKIFPAIATIRTSTRNDTVRKLAQRANQFVMTHLTLLESSGIVDFAALPTAPPPATATSAAAPLLATAGSTQQQGGSTLVSTPVLIGVVVASFAVAVFATRRFLPDPRRRRRRYRSSF
jgi:putative membrane protein